MCFLDPYTDGLSFTKTHQKEAPAWYVFVSGIFPHPFLLYLQSILHLKAHSTCVLQGSGLRWERGAQELGQHTHVQPPTPTPRGSGELLLDSLFCGSLPT